MPIDSSMYQSLTPVPVKMPDAYESAQKAMALSQMGMQQMQMARQMKTQSDMQEAMYRSTDPQTGQLDQGKYLSTLGGMNPFAAQQETGRIAEQNKQVAEAKASQLDAATKTLNITGPAFDYMSKMTPENRAAAYPNVIQQLKDQGVDTSRMEHPYDEGLFNQYLGAWNQSKPKLENMLTQANTDKSLAETDKARADTGKVAIDRQTEYQKLLLNDERYKEAGGVLTQGNSALAAVDDAVKNPQSRTELPIVLARFSTGGKRMSNVEVENGAKAGDFGDKIKQMYLDGQQGVLSPKMADYARQYITSQMKPAAQNKLAVENDIAGKYAMAAGLKQTDAYAKLTSQSPGTIAQTPDGPARFANGAKTKGDADVVQSAGASTNVPKPLPPGMIRMKGPGPNGKVYRVRAEDKAEAIAAGGSVVQ